MWKKLFFLLLVMFVAHHLKAGELAVHPKIQTFLDQIRQIPQPDKSKGTALVEEGRKQYEIFVVNYAGPTWSVSKVEDVSVPSSDANRSIPVRIYTPNTEKTLPILIYFHGGGWQRGNLNTHDSICRRLATKGDCVVVAVDWRLAPEHKFPDGLDDCHAVYHWVIGESSGKDLPRIDRNRVAIGGDSAGGNLTAALSHRLRDEKAKMPVLQLLFYPSLDLTLAYESYKKFAKGYFLETERVAYCRDLYLRSPEDIQNPLASPLLAKDFKGLPPTHVVTAGYDPLQDEGKAYAEKLQASSIAATHHRYPDMIHAFLHFTGLVPEIEKVFDDVGQILQQTFKK